MSDNPYAAPSTDASPAVTAATVTSHRSLTEIARTTFLAWEKLRIAYVAILAAICVLLVGPSSFANRRLLALLIEGAVFANVAYFLGPTVETYVRWLGYDRQWPRWVMFLSGTLLAMILTVGTLATVLLPNQN